jgi:hypothetical protein
MYYGVDGNSGEERKEILAPKLSTGRNLNSSTKGAY